MVIEILLFILGAAFMIISFFVGNETKEEKVEGRSFEFPEEQLQEAEKKVSDTITTSSENVIIDTENKLSAISNETIMFVDDFSKQTLERIQHNHEEVVFMYNMLQNKEEELKNTLGEIDKEKSNLEKQKIELANMMTPKLPEESGIEMARKKSAGEKAAAAQKKTVKQPVKEVPVSIEPPVVNETEFADTDEANKNKKILELYRQKKSVLEISKQLGLGQGEVKLVIDLYGRQ